MAAKTYNSNPAAPVNNKHHQGGYRSLDDFYEQFRYDPDYPDTLTIPNWQESAWYIEVTDE